MLKRFLRICCVILTLTMLINTLPLNAVAEEYFSAEASETVMPKQIDTSKAKIVGEVKANRSKYSKEFLLDNGLYVSAVYPQPVHYEVNGQWEEIDNTLQLHTDGTYSNKAGVWDVRFPQQLTGNSDITITKDGYTLSFRMAGQLSQPGNLEVAAVGLQTAATETVTLQPAGETAQTFAVQSAQSVQGQVQTVDLSQSKQEVQFTELIAEKNVSQLMYTDIYGTTDVLYDLKANRVKESVILERYDSTLRGYCYTLNTGDMIPVLQKDNSIYFYDAKMETVVMAMPAPYLIDSANEMCYDVEVLLTQTGSTWTLSYILSRKWLAAEERSWPVILDPVVVADLSDQNIQDTTIISARVKEADYLRATLQIGYSAADGISRILLGFEELPSLKSSDVILEAQVSLRKIGAGSGTVPVTAHKVLDTWEVETASWDDNIAFDPTVEDYALVKNAGRYYWNVTDLVRYWYEEENTGMLIKATDEIEQSGNTSSWKEFYSCNYGNDSTDPALVIVYRNNNGIENYWDYTTVSAGQAGTGYINNYTGNLVWTHSDIGFGGNRMPVTINHIYNLNDAENNTFGLGYGWRTNFNQRISSTYINDHKYYIWEDSDGTSHYFYNESYGVFKDEDGLDLILRSVSVASNTGISGAQYSITDEDGNISVFDSKGRLICQRNNQETKSSITITYTDTTGNLISKITDGAGRGYQFSYPSGLLDKISYLGTGTTEIDSVSFDYDGSLLSSAYGTDGEEYAFYYDTDNNLNEVRDYSSYTLKFTHYPITEDWQPYRVQGICEYDGTAKGGELTFVYENNQTTITDVVNGNKELLQFNNYGNLLSIQDDEGRAQYAKYANNDALNSQNTAPANQLKLSSKLQNTVGNLIKNSSFESSIGYYYSPTSAQVTNPTGEAFRGSHVLKMDAPDDTYLTVETFTVQPGESYSFSAYAKLLSGSAHIILAPAGNPTGNTVSQTLTGSSDWTRLQAAYTNTSDAAVSVSALLWCYADTQVYFDCAQLEKAVTASRYNLVDNGDFRSGGYGWTVGSFTSTTASAPAPALDHTAYEITGDPQAQKRMTQEISLSGSAGDTFVLTGWAKGQSAPLTDNNESNTNVRQYGILGTFHYTDGETKEFAAQFNPDTDQWQYSAQVMVAEKDYSSITVAIAYDYNVNTACFDGIQLYKEEFGNSYTYDEDGNVISVKDLQGKTTNYEYNTSGDLTRIIQDNKAKMTYDYDSYHNVTAATSEEGISYEFTYDTFGNNTTVAIVSEGNKITSSASYTEDGNRMVSSTDALGNVTKYSYNADTNMLEWVQYPEDTDGTGGTTDTRTYYSYDDMYRMSYATVNTDTSDYFWVDYYYNNEGLLSGIETMSTEYEFYYGVFNLRSSVKIGEYTLAEYSYTDDRNYYLESLDYGNGDRVEYEYDDMGRVIKQTYEDGETVTYRYDNSGALATVTDSKTGITATYYYEFTDRMMKYVESGDGYSHSIGYEYDQLNNLTKIVDTINGTTRTTSYTYDQDNRLISETTDGITVEYAYDELGRITSQTVKEGESVKHTNTYGYASGSAANTTTTQVTSHNGYTYTYDGNGNILSVSDGTYTTSYVYDSQNQLIRENNQQINKTWTWDYDNAGNILEKKEYAYTTGTLGTPADTVEYDYDDDSGWGDLLTSYDGNAITYDGIGNPLSDGNRTYTWQHGRQLATLSDGTTTWSYTYNADGLRTEKTNGTAVYTYVYSGSQLAQMTVGTDTLYFSYDASGVPVAVTLNGTVYYYATNLQGDVIAILDASGNAVVEYTYDAWGNILTQTGTMAATLGTINPLRYRGYVYDHETELYYLQSRYYDPMVGRFINADGYNSTGQGFVGNNMFAYCGNDPAANRDTQGTKHERCAGGGGGFGYVGGYGGGGGGGGGGTGTAFAGLSSTVATSKEYIVQGYRTLRKNLSGTGLQAHHIIEKRLVKHLNIDLNNMLSIGVSVAEHQSFTSAWRGYYKYGMDYSGLTVDELWETAQKVYANIPQLLDAAEKILFK